ncbi:MAG: Ribosomal methyltransferase [Chloroflexi bacterium]|nr:Ribosomal methyltransferase [Chloroflexota bacterium]
MTEPEGGAIDQVVAAVSHSAKYRRVSLDLIRAIAEQELAAHRKEKDAVKAVKNRLHQVCGAFFIGEPRYATWLQAIEHAVQQGEPVALRAACGEAMLKHTSTRERLPIIERFYGELVEGLAPDSHILDIGCGLNPLAIPWMRLPERVSYTCYDIDAGLIDFLNAYFAAMGISGHAELRNVVTDPPHAPASLALVLKVLPTLDQIQRDAGAALLRGLAAPRMLVSFPAHSLGGVQKGMAATYSARFLALADSERWQVRQITFASEIAFLVTR